MVLALAICGRPSGVRAVARNPEAALSETLSARGLSCAASDVTWMAREHGLRAFLSGRARALVRAHVLDEPSDLYVVEARLSPEGSLVSVEGTWNVTQTSGVDESRPVLKGESAVYSTSTDGLMIGIHVLDLAGRPSVETSGLSRLQRIQVALTNLQQTGRAAGIVHTAFAFDQVARRGSFEWRDDGLVEARADDRVVILDPSHRTVVSGAEFVRVLPDEPARPGNLVTWAVDRVRALPWVGDDRMQWVKAVAFTLFDALHVTLAPKTTAEDVRSELGISSPPRSSSETYTDPETGWPPPAIAPLVLPPISGEGRWIALEADPFITPTTHGAPAFVTTFLRPDAGRPDVRVYVTLWDPRQIELHIEAGTVEPISANGEHGPGMIPRTPAVMGHLVAAFNGGFQAQHGEYGMQADGVEYLPPKPYAATVFELRDGSNAFGAWPDSPDVPDDVVAFRQNLTALVQDGRFNPWGRTWWGGAPPGWPDQVHTTRSALCLTKENFVGYFYSTSISPDDLAQGMLAARCTFGIHLDMNPGHAGFEFYNVAPENRLGALGRRLQNDWEAEGPVPDMPGYVFRSRRMIRAMGHMLFPRYIQRESRDFFYLTTRSILPAAAAVPAGEGAPSDDHDDRSDATGAAGADARSTTPEGVWRTTDLPQHGFPYAVATTWLQSGADAAVGARLKLQVAAIDPRTVAPADRAPPDGFTVVAFAGPVHGSLALEWTAGAFSIAAAGPASDASALIAGYAFDDARSPVARASAGIRDEDGTLVWIELPDGAAADGKTLAAMDAALRRLGCSARMAIPGGAHAILGGTREVSGSPVTEGAPLLVSRLVRARAPDAHSIFGDTPIVPIQVWQPLQKKRVRYFYKPPASATASAAIGTVPPVLLRAPVGDRRAQTPTRTSNQH
ncbi:MAG TPA: hypothetical protein VEK07_04900 [Polyangiaceae bacterium]|nr:hypothetical protein [Polyangiaceae bacterium]